MPEDPGVESPPSAGGSQGSPSGADRAYELLFSDLVERVMSLADDPQRCVDYIAEELRSVIGAKTVIVGECPSMIGGEAHLPVAVFPERRWDLARHPMIEVLAEASHGRDRAYVVEPGEEGEEGRALAALGLGQSLVLPLRYASTRAGVVLLLDLLDRANIGSVLSTLDRLSKVLALILRNGWLYGNLERRVEERTAELAAKTAALEAMLREKEVMLKEIHHRVKNNLQIVLSLLYLKAGAAKDEETRRLFEESESRIAAMALVHEELYRSGDLAGVDMDDYLSGLVSRLVEASNSSPRITFGLEALRLSPEEAIPIGLIVNELVMNSLKYAFAGRMGGRLDVALRLRGDSIEVEVADDGPGLGEAFGREDPGHVGLSIVSVLASQLHGRVESLPGPGARVRITVRAPGGR